MRAVLVTVAVTLLAGGCGSESQVRVSQPAAKRAVTRPAFQRAVLVVFENKDRSTIAGRRAAPTFNAYARRYASLTDYHAITHPSLPNYLALVSGSTHGTTSDCSDCTVDAVSIADSLESAGLSWKVYAERLPSVGFLGGGFEDYTKHHDPFIYFRSILEAPDRLGRIVPFTQFQLDLAGRTMPAFSLVVPDLCHDMHDCSVEAGDKWLHGLLPPLLRSPQMRHGVVFVLFDESKSKTTTDGGHVFAFAAGGAVRSHSTYARRLTHYGLLATLEANWRLRRLGESANERPIAGIWRGGK
jgi:phosphatidylinositol-3-phosphatase